MYVLSEPGTTAIATSAVPPRSVTPAMIAASRPSTRAGWMVASRTHRATPSCKCQRASVTASTGGAGDSRQTRRPSSTRSCGSPAAIEPQYVRWRSRKLISPIGCSKSRRLRSGVSKIQSGGRSSRTPRDVSRLTGPPSRIAHVLTSVAGSNRGAAGPQPASTSSQTGHALPA
jgi:hypothetical protein